MPGQLSLKASSPNEKPFSPTVVKPHARKLAKASRRSCERPEKNERTFEQPPFMFIFSGQSGLRGFDPQSSSCGFNRFAEVHGRDNVKRVGDMFFANVGFGLITPLKVNKV